MLLIRQRFTVIKWLSVCKCYTNEPTGDEKTTLVKTKGRWCQIDHFSLASIYSCEVTNYLIVLRSHQRNDKNPSHINENCIIIKWELSSIVLILFFSAAHLWTQNKWIIILLMWAFSLSIFLWKAQFRPKRWASNLTGLICRWLLRCSF